MLTALHTLLGTRRCSPSRPAARLQGEIIEIEGKAARFTCATLETAQFGDPRAVKVPGPA